MNRRTPEPHDCTPECAQQCAAVDEILDELVEQRYPQCPECGAPWAGGGTCKHRPAGAR